MIIVDSALQAREKAGNPIRVGLIGAGFMGRGITNQICRYMPGMRLAAISNRTLATAERACREAGITDVSVVRSLDAINQSVARGVTAVTDDATLLCRAEGIDVLIEATGHVEFGARITTLAIEQRKPIVSMNAELDGTVGPILRVMAHRAGVVFSGCDGDQPGVQLNLYRFVKSLGLTPLVCGNIKGLQDRYRNPTTQAGFAAPWGQNPEMVTSFADGTKISFEQAIVANATGMRVAKRGMLGYEFTGHVDEMTNRYDIDQLRALGGIVDYVVGAKPSPGVFCFATTDDPLQRHHLNLYKLGEGPLYSFYTPYHLVIFEVALSAARVVLFGDAVIAAKGAPLVDVIALAKVDLKAGDVIDGLGGYKTYGECENVEIVRKENLLPIGLALDCRLKRDVARDQALTYDDVEVPKGRLSDRLRAEQDAHFADARPASAAAA
jgi:predicted homoserine dehydrogenase-like protein